MIKFVSEIFLNPLNDLYPFFLKFDSQNRFRKFLIKFQDDSIQVSHNSSDNSSLIQFPDETKFICILARRRVVNLQIKYPNNAFLEGNLLKSSKNLIDIIQKGKFIFTDHQYIIFKRNKFSLISLVLYDKNGEAVEKYNGEPIKRISDCGRFIKIIDNFFVTEGQINSNQDLIKGIRYSTLGPYYSSFDFSDIKS